MPAFNFKEKYDLDGFTYSIGGGVKYQITESVHVKAGYEFNRIYLGDFFGENIIPNMHVISVGLGYKF
jgi:opacity protein-like surface antigen